jgi:broad specificity phosphatase PhoE
MAPGPAGCTLVFIRHGETDWNVASRLQGQKDIPLNDNGRAQARRNGLNLVEAVPGIRQFRFVASPLGRARETMEIIRAAMGLDPAAYEIDPSLKEITFGEWEGFTFAELEAAGTRTVDERAADKWGFVPPRGESYAMLSDRIGRWLRTVETDTVAVSHGAVGRVVRGLMQNLPQAEVPLLPAPQDQVAVFRSGRCAWV